MSGSSDSAEGGSLNGKVSRARQRVPGLDRMVRTQQHYGKVQGAQQAGAVTYFGFLSIFPILALAVFVVGQIAKVYDEADQSLLTDAINSVLPGMVGEEPGKISLSSVENFSGWAGLIGVAGVLYAGLGWVSSLRNALAVVFERPVTQRAGFVIGKLRDLAALVVIGLILVMAVAVTGAVSGWSRQILEGVGLSADLSWLLTLLSLALGLAANALLFYALFHLPTGVEVPRPALWQGAVLGAVAFELLKQLSKPLLALTKDQPAFQVFGLALILLVWINYSSRAIMYAAAFAHVAPAARAERERTASAASTEPAPETPAPTDDVPSPRAAALFGAVTTLGVLALWRSIRQAQETSKGPR